MKEKVIATLESIGLNRDDALVLGYSGGPDSLALGHILVEAGYQPHLAILDHQIRAESAQEVERAKSQASTWGTSISVDVRDVGLEASQKGLSVEFMGRELRYQFLFRIGAEIGARAVLTGHHADDQVETILLHLTRGSGIGGLAGMSWREILPQWHPTIPLVRPMLGVWRPEIEAYCQENNLSPITDSTNSDLAFARNRIRHRIVPELERINPQAKEAVLRLSEIAREEDSTLHNLVIEASKSAILSKAHGRIDLNLDALVAQPVAIQRRLVFLSLIELNSDVEPSLGLIARVLDWANRPQTNATVEFHVGVRGVRRGTRLILSDVEGDLSDLYHFPMMDEEPISLPVPGDIALAGGWRIELDFAEELGLAALAESQELGRDRFYVSSDKIANRKMYARRVAQGDRIQPFGMRGKSKKVSDLFVDLKVPVEARTSWPLVCIDDEIVWIPGLGASEFGRIEGDSESIIQLTLLPPFTNP